MRSIPALSLAALLVVAASPVCVAEGSAAEGKPLPDWLRPGARVSYFQGTASVQTSGQILVQDDKGNWVTIEGTKYAEKDNPGVGGGGVLQLTVLAADARAVVAETRVFTLTDPAQGRVSAASVGALIGTPEALSDYWIAPTSLTERKATRDGGLTVRRMSYPLRTRSYDALVTEVRTGTSYQRTVYDLATGLLLAASSSSVGASGFVPNPNGTSTWQAGGTTISSTIRIDVRQLSTPWLDDPRPEEVTAGARYDYRGTFTTAIPGLPPVGQALSTHLVYGEPGARWAPARFHASLASVLGGPPPESASERVQGAAATLPAWIAPRTIERLASGTVVDEDPVTRFRTTFVGVRDGLAIVVEEGPFDRVEAAFDVRTGILQTATDVRQSGSTELRVRMQRVLGR